MKEIIGFLLTIIASVIVILLSEMFKINLFVAVIISIVIFMILVIISFGYYLNQINYKINNSIRQIQEIKKDLNIDNRLVKLEEGMEWLKKK